MDGLISINGEISPASKAAVPAQDRGLLFGDNVFEVIVGFGDVLLDVPEHLVRLRQSADELFIPIPWSDSDLTFEIQSLAAEIKAKKKYIRLVVTRGCGMGLSVQNGMQPNRFIYAFPAAEQPRSHYKDGLALKRKLMSHTDRGPNPKTGNYLNSILALRAAEKEGFEDIIWTNSENELTECSTANIFFLGREGDLVEVATPAPASGILLGITRSTIMRLLNQAQIPVTERVIYADEIPRFDEAFICSTIRGLIPIRQVDRHKLHTCRPSSIYQHIERLYLTWIESQLGHRVDWNTGKPV